MAVERRASYPRGFGDRIDGDGLDPTRAQQAFRRVQEPVA